MFLFFLCCLLIVQISTAQNFEFCKNNLQNKGACCPASCTRCGAAGCSLRDGGYLLPMSLSPCCPADIKNISRACTSESDTGCLAVVTPTPTLFPTVVGDPGTLRPTIGESIAVVGDWAGYKDKQIQINTDGSLPPIKIKANGYLTSDPRFLLDVVISNCHGIFYNCITIIDTEINGTDLVVNTADQTAEASITLPANTYISGERIKIWAASRYYPSKILAKIDQPEYRIVTTEAEVVYPSPTLSPLPGGTPYPSISMQPTIEGSIYLVGEFGGEKDDQVWMDRFGNLPTLSIVVEHTLVSDPRFKINIKLKNCGNSFSCLDPWFTISVPRSEMIIDGIKAIANVEITTLNQWGNPVFSIDDRIKIFAEARIGGYENRKLITLNNEYRKVADRYASSPTLAPGQTHSPTIQQSIYMTGDYVGEKDSLIDFDANGFLPQIQVVVESSYVTHYYFEIQIKVSNCHDTFSDCGDTALFESKVRGRNLLIDGLKATAKVNIPVLDEDGSRLFRHGDRLKIFTQARLASPINENLVKIDPVVYRIVNDKRFTSSPSLSPAGTPSPTIHAQLKLLGAFGGNKDDKVYFTSSKGLPPLIVNVLSSFADHHLFEIQITVSNCKNTFSDCGMEPIFSTVINRVDEDKIQFSGISATATVNIPTFNDQGLPIINSGDRLKVFSQARLSSPINQQIARTDGVHYAVIEDMTPNPTLAPVGSAAPTNPSTISIEGEFAGNKDDVVLVGNANVLPPLKIKVNSKEVSNELFEIKFDIRNCRDSFSNCETSWYQTTIKGFSLDISGDTATAVLFIPKTHNGEQAFNLGDRVRIYAQARLDFPKNVQLSTFEENQYRILAEYHPTLQPTKSPSFVSVPTMRPTAQFAKPGEQCGGQSYHGPTECENGFTCVFYSRVYSECELAATDGNKSIQDEGSESSSSTSDNMTFFIAAGVAIGMVVLAFAMYFFSKKSRSRRHQSYNLETQHLDYGVYKSNDDVPKSSIELVAPSAPTVRQLPPALANFANSLAFSSPERSGYQSTSMDEENPNPPFAYVGTFN